MSKISHKGSGDRRIVVSGGNYMANALAASEAVATMGLQRQTWGHLAPKSGRRYSGCVVFTHTAWGVTTLIDANFDGLEMSPWLFDDLLEFVEGHVDGLGPDVEPTVFRFRGHYQKNRNGTCGFIGSIERLDAKTDS